MKNWNDMTPDERVVGVLTKVCGWKYVDDDSCLPYFKDATGIEHDEDELPPILTDATTCIEHVGKAVEKKDKSGIPQRIWIYSTYSETLDIWDREVWGRFNVATAKPIARGRGDLATALAEAAWYMKEGEEG